MKNSSFLLVACTLAWAAVMALPAAAQFNPNFSTEPGPAEGEPQPLSPESVQALPSAPPPALVTTREPPPLAPSSSSSMPASSTDLQVRMNALETMVRNLTGQVERITFQNNQLLQGMQRAQSDNDVRFRQIESRMAQQDGSMQQMAKDVQNATLGLPPPGSSGETSPVASRTPPAAQPQPAPAEEKEDAAAEIDIPTTPKTPSSKTLGTISSGKNDDADAQAKYDRAFMALREARYDAAEQDFRLFLKDHPRHRLSENASYWLAETYYVREKFEEAATAFADSYQKYPKGSKAPDNLLKLAMSLAALKKSKDACTTLDELLKRYPSAAAVTRSRAEAQKKNLECL